MLSVKDEKIMEISSFSMKKGLSFAKNSVSLRHAPAGSKVRMICRGVEPGAQPSGNESGACHKILIIMYLTPEKKQELFGQYGKSTTDTGSPESQIALFTYRINHLTEHMKSNRHDYGTQRSLLRLVGKRRKLLMYLKEVDIERYRAIVKTLNLRK